MRLKIHKFDVQLEDGDKVILDFSRWDPKCNLDHPEGPGGYEFGTITITKPSDEDLFPEVEVKTLKKNSVKVKRIATDVLTGERS